MLQIDITGTQKIQSMNRYHLNKQGYEEESLKVLGEMEYRQLRKHSKCVEGIFHREEMSQLFGNYCVGHNIRQCITSQLYKADTAPSSTKKKTGSKK